MEVILCFLLMYIGLRMYINWACTISPFVKTPLKALIWWFLSYILCKTKVKRNLELTVYIKSSLLQHYSIINDNQNVLLCKMLISPLYFLIWCQSKWKYWNCALIPFIVKYGFYPKKCLKILCTFVNFIRVKLLYHSWSFLNLTIISIPVETRALSLAMTQSFLACSPRVSSLTKPSTPVFYLSGNSI